MKRLSSYLSSIALVAIILILLIPSWRIAFQGWVQGMLVGEHEFIEETNIPTPEAVEHWILTKVNDKTSQEFSTFYGKPVILSFWATWCPPCRAELKELKELRTKTKELAHFVSVSEESIATIEASGLQNDYDFLYSTNRFPTFFNVTNYPTLVIISPNGNLVHSTTGAADIATEKNTTFIQKLAQKE